MKKERHWKRFSLLVISFTVVLWGMNAGASVSWAAEKYPDRPVNMIVGFSPGGASDLGSKIIADKVSEFLGQPLVATYKPGGGGTLSASYVAKAKPDGYTTLVMVSFMNLPPEVKKLDYKLDDFVLTGLWGRAPYFIIVKADAKWKTLKDFVEDAKKNPGKLTYGSAGVNTGGHFVGTLLEKQAGIKLTHVPFKSCADALTAMMGGHVSAYICVGIGEAKDTATQRTLATAEQERLEGLEEIPTVAELGWPVYFSTWYTFAFPKGTPDRIVDTFSKAQQKAIEKYKKEITQNLNRVNMWPSFGAPQGAVKEFKNQYNVIREIMKETSPEKK